VIGTEFKSLNLLREITASVKNEKLRVANFPEQFIDVFIQAKAGEQLTAERYQGFYSFKKVREFRKKAVGAALRS
jgi:hypothetical protein